jgi:hypothetical protein
LALRATLSRASRALILGALLHQNDCRHLNVTLAPHQTKILDLTLLLQFQDVRKLPLEKVETTSLDKSFCFYEVMYTKM